MKIRRVDYSTKKVLNLNNFQALHGYFFELLGKFKNKPEKASGKIVQKMRIKEKMFTF